MTKEKLIQIVKTFDFYSTKNKEGLISKFEEFFESNICIPKGGTLQAKVEDKWEDIFTTSKLIEYRIKPSELVYEWYCLYKPMQSTEWQPNGFMSQGEIMKWKSEHRENWCITFVEETKRIRQ